MMIKSLGFNDIFETVITDNDFKNDLMMNIGAEPVNISTDNIFLYNLFPDLDRYGNYFNIDRLLLLGKKPFRYLN